MSSFSNYRNVSIYNDQKQFKNDNDELFFAKSYNEKMYGKGKENDLKQQYMAQPDSGFQNTIHTQYLSNNIKQYRDLRQNNPNYVSGNPITHSGKVESDFKPTVKKTQFSDIDNFNAANNWDDNNLKSPEKIFKSSSRKIEVQQSETQEPFQKRQLKTSQSYSQYVVSRNPILQGDGDNPIPSKPRQVAGDQKISEAYTQMQDNRYLLPADRQHVQKGYSTSQIFFNDGLKAPTQPQNQRVPQKHTGSNCKDLISNCDYADSKDKLTSKCTQLNPKEREVAYGQLNYFCDYRKRSGVLNREEKQADR